jgi:hypothetical protein
MSEPVDQAIITQRQKALERLLTAAEDLDAALDGVTEEFDSERAELQHACDAARATLSTSPVSKTAMDIDIHELLARRGEIALIWSVEDVQEVRSDLTARQAWDVLKQVQNRHDATIGVSWETLEWVARDLFGDAPETLQP